LNLELARAENHGHVELEYLYHERVKISYRLKEYILRNNKMEMRA
jgi:hypothetical protein